MRILPLTPSGCRSFAKQAIEQKQIRYWKRTCILWEDIIKEAVSNGWFCKFFSTFIGHKGCLIWVQVEVIRTPFWLRGVALPSQPYVETHRVVWIPSDGVLWFDFFVLRGSFHGYPLKEVIIKARGYRMFMVPFFLVLAYCQGWRFNHLVSFWVLY